MEKWGQEVHPQKGLLHSNMHVPENKKIPITEERAILAMPVGSNYKGITVTPKLKSEINFYLNISGKGKQHDR